MPPKSRQGLSNSNPLNSSVNNEGPSIQGEELAVFFKIVRRLAALDLTENNLVLENGPTIDGRLGPSYSAGHETTDRGSHRVDPTPFGVRSFLILAAWFHQNH
jgi:hypothetical protein